MSVQAARAGPSIPWLLCGLWTCSVLALPVKYMNASAFAHAVLHRLWFIRSRRLVTIPFVLGLMGK